MGGTQSLREFSEAYQWRLHKMGTFGGESHCTVANKTV